MLCVLAFASPSLRLSRSVLQPDGSVLTVVRIGDESLSFFITDDGYAVVANGANGFCYATGYDGGQWSVSVVMAHGGDVRGFAESQWLEAEGIKATDVWEKAKVKTQAKAVRAIGRSENPKGEFTYPIILVEFSDVSFSVINAVDTFARQFNEQNFSGGGAKGSVRDYFMAQSKGIYGPSFSVTAKVTLPKPYAYYGARNGSANDSHVGEMAKEAVKLAEQNGVDFSQFKGTDGYVPLVGLVFAGLGENTSWDEDAVWSSFYRNSINASTAKINSYLVVNELMPSLHSSDGGSTVDTLYNIEGIGTFCHEFSHFLGLPDFYNVYNSSSTKAMSWWSIMDYGQYYGNGAFPMGYTAYEKNFMGWLPIDTLKTEKQVVRLNALGSADENAYYIMNDSDATGNEYYILENRQPSTWYPRNLGTGMLVVHVDYSASAWSANTVNTVASHRRMSYVPADNDLKFEYEATPADYKGDLFPGTTGNTSLRDTSTPDFQQYTGKGLGKFLTCITDTQGVVSFVYMAEGVLPAPQGLKVTTDEQVKTLVAGWDETGGADKYRVQLVDGDSTVYVALADSNSIELGGFPDCNNLTLKVTAMADNYIASETSVLDFNNPVGISWAKRNADGTSWSVYSVSGVCLKTGIKEDTLKERLPKGVYILRSDSGCTQKLLVR